MRAFILAGGLGTRLRPLFPETPKSLVVVGGAPIVVHQIRQLATHGINDIVLCVGFGADTIIDRLGNGADLGVRLRYVRERRPLGTAGALRHARRLFTATSAVLNGDTYLALDWQAMARYHASDGSTIATLAVVAVADVGPYGQVQLDEGGRVTTFVEKGMARGSGLASAGCYLLEPAVLEYVPVHGSVSLEYQVFPRLLAAGRTVRAFRTPGPFVDMGTPEGYQALRELLE